LTFKEYLVDYAGENTKRAGAMAIKNNLEDIPSEERRLETCRRIMRIEQGERDIYF
jgi:2-iminoacetate synthase